MKPERNTPSLFPDTPDGMLSKAKALTRMCPDIENWTCAIGYVEYKLAPSADQIHEEVVDQYMDWLAGLKAQLEATGDCDEPFENEVNAERIGRLMSLVVEHLYSL